MQTYSSTHFSEFAPLTGDVYAPNFRENICDKKLSAEHARLPRYIK